MNAWQEFWEQFERSTARERLWIVGAGTLLGMLLASFVVSALVALGA